MNRRAEQFGVALAGFFTLLSATYANRPERAPETILDRVGQDKFVRTGTLNSDGTPLNGESVGVYRKTSGFFEPPSYEKQSYYRIIDDGRDGVADALVVIRDPADFNIRELKILYRSTDYPEHKDEFENADTILRNYERFGEPEEKKQ